MNGTILRYKGSKWKTRKTITALAPLQYDWYAEPFLGGAAVMLEQSPEIPRYGNDLHWDVFHFWDDLKRNGLVERAITLRERSIRMGSDELMALFEQMKSVLVFENDALAYFFLDRFAHQHLVRRDRKNIASFDARYCRCGIRPVQPELLHEARELLQRVELFNLDFAEFLEMMDGLSGRGWLFIDPPYWINDHGSPFYHLFTAEDHDRLRAWMMQTKHFVSLTVGDDCKTHRIYKTMPGWSSLPMYYRYQTRTKGEKRPMKKEWLIRNFD